MGIINITPDSFSDGGQFVQSDAAFKHAETLIEEGADILDLGGESTRPGADFVSEQQELDRIIPVIEQIHRSFEVPISVDTYKPVVMQEAIKAGASMINDVNALQAEGAVAVVANSNVPVCLMHKQGTPKQMQLNPEYNDVVNDVIGFLEQRINVCIESGIQKEKIITDPGIGFGKTLKHNLALLNAIPTIIKKTETPLLLGVSRKSMIDMLLERQVDERLSASIGLAVQAVLNGAKIIRVHDVKETRDAIRSVEAVNQIKELIE